MQVLLLILGFATGVVTVLTIELLGLAELLAPFQDIIRVLLDLFDGAGQR